MRNFRTGFTALASLLLFAFSQMAMARWQWVNPLPTGNPASALTWDGNQFIGFDTADTIITSADGGTWTTSPTDLLDFVDTIVWGNGVYVAAGSGFFSASVFSSPDGVTWTAHDTGVPASNFSQVLWNADLQQFVLIADSGFILTSADGITWVPQASGTINDLDGIVWSNDKYVIVGANGTVLTSANGIDWDDHSIANSTLPLLSVSANGSLFAIVQGTFPNNDHSAILTNADPTDPQGWKIAFSVVDPSTSSRLTRIVWDGTAFVAIGGIIATSVDGAIWTFVESGARDVLGSVAFNDAEIVVADASGDILVSALDGQAWALTSSNIVSEHLTSVIWTGELFAAVSDFGSFLSSPDGLEWEVDNFAFPVAANALATNGDTFVAVGEGGIASSGNGGLSWDISASSGLSQVEFNSVAWGANRFVAVGNIVIGTPPHASFLGKIFTSPDGSAWTAQVSNAVDGDNIHSVIWAGNRFVAVGSSIAHSADGDVFLQAPPVFTSADGTQWTRTTPLQAAVGATALLSVAWSGSRFVAVGTPGFNFDQRAIATSPDAVQWDFITALPDPPTSAGALESVTWTGSKFVTVGASTAELSSPDGLTWTAHSTGAADLSAVAGSGTRCIAVGDLGTIMREDDLCNADAVFKNGFE